MADFKLDPNYNDVASRLGDLREKWPDASCQPADLARPFWIENVVDADMCVHVFLVYVAACYRYPDDPRPGIGTAWEPFPGRTPYTRDSEVMVAETSAWGRAIVAALAADTKKGIASSDEIAARQREPEASPEARQALVDLIGTLDEPYKQTVAVWLRNKKVPSLRRSGATLTQLNELEDFISALGTEPFEVTTNPLPGVVSEVETIPFNPIVASAADDSGTARKARAAAAASVARTEPE